MNSTFTKLVIIFFFLFSGKSYAQIDFNFDELKGHLNTYHYDTIIGYSSYENYDLFDYVEIKNIGKIDIVGMGFFIGIKDSNISAFEFLETADRLLKSSPIKLTKNMIYDSLFKNVPLISKENVLPYTYTYKIDNFEDSTIATGMHESSCNVFFLAKDSLTRRNFFPTHFDEFWKGSDIFPRNKNYPHNISLTSYKIYVALLKLFSDLKDKFEFK